MDGQHLELFRKLTAGTKINVQRFRKDLEILKILKPKPVDDTKKTESSPRKGKKRKAEAVTHENGGGRKKKKISPKLEHNTSSPPASDSSDDGNEQEAAALSDTDAEESSSHSDAEESSPHSDEGMPSPPPSVDRDSGDEEEEEDSRPVSSERRKKKKKKKKSAQLLAQLHKEEMNHVRNQHKINVYGTDIPDPVTSFEELQAEYGLHEQVLENVREAGYKDPTPIQMQAIPIMMKRRNIMACAPTGSGKTAAFILPILHHLKEPRNCGIRALVLAPTRELAKQIFREFHKLSEGRGLRIQFIEKASYGGAKFKKKCDIVVTTPNRMVFMLQQDPPQIDLSSVEWMIVDESDKLFEDGKTGFRNQLAVIYKACDSSSVRRGMFSATFAEDVQEWCRLHLDNVAQVYIGTRNTATSTIEQKLVFVGQECGKLFEMRQMIQRGLQPPVLVFVQSKDRAKQLYFELLYLNVSVDVIHAEKTQLQRDNVVRAFREGKIWVLICTELMGRGIDFKGVNLVINYDFPTSAISYIHRIGRTGRAGQPGKAITFFTLDDHPHLKSIANVMREAGCEVPDFLLKLGRPPKKERKKLARQQVKRKPISKAYKKDRAQLKRKRQLKAKIFKQGKGKSKKTGTEVAANS